MTKGKSVDPGQHGKLKLAKSMKPNKVMTRGRFADRFASRRLTARPRFTAGRSFTMGRGFTIGRGFTMGRGMSMGMRPSFGRSSFMGGMGGRRFF